MHTTKGFLTAVKARHGLTSDYQLAQVLGVTRASISTLQLGRSFLGHDSAMKVAELLDLDPAYVIACTDAERAKTDKIRTVYARIAGAFATVAIVAGITAPPSPAHAKSASSVYYVKSRKLRAALFNFGPALMPA